MRYVVIEAQAQGDAAHFKHVEKYEDGFLMSEGESLAGSFPPDALYRMNPDFPDSLRLVDILQNLDSQLIVSDRVREFLGTRKVDGVEYLPVAIMNHKGRKAATYYIVNILRIVDCIDQSRTKFSWNSIDPELMDQVSNLTIDESRIDPGIRIFRPEHLKPLIMIDRDLAAGMKAAGFEEFSVVDPSQVTF